MVIEVGKAEELVIAMPGKNNDDPGLPLWRDVGQSMFVRRISRVVHGLWTKVGQLLSATGQPDAWIAGTRTVGRVGSGRPAGSTFEGIGGAHRPDIYLDATWQLVE